MLISRESQTLRKDEKFLLQDKTVETVVKVFPGKCLLVVMTRWRFLYYHPQEKVKVLK